MSRVQKRSSSLASAFAPAQSSGEPGYGHLSGSSPRGRLDESEADKRLPASVVEVEVVASGAERMRRVCAWPGHWLNALVAGREHERRQRVCWAGLRREPLAREREGRRSLSFQPTCADGAGCDAQKWQEPAREVVSQGRKTDRWKVPGEIAGRSDAVPSELESCGCRSEGGGKPWEGLPNRARQGVGAGAVPTYSDGPRGPLGNCQPKTGGADKFGNCRQEPGRSSFISQTSPGGQIDWLCSGWAEQQRRGLGPRMTRDRGDVTCEVV